MGRGEAEVNFLVEAGRRQNDVREGGGRAHPDVAGDDELVVGPGVLEELLEAAARPAKRRAGDAEIDARRLVSRRTHQAVPPAAVHRLVHVFAERALHLRIVPVRVIPDFLVTGVVIPVEGRRHHERRRGHPLDDGLAADLLALDLDQHHLLGQRVVLLQEALLRPARIACELKEPFEAGLRLEQVAGDELGAVPAAHAGALAAEVAGEGEQQRHGPLHQVAVVVLADAEALEDVDRLRLRHFPGEAADDAGANAGDLRRSLDRVLGDPLAHDLECGPHLDRGAVKQGHLCRAVEGRRATFEVERSARRLHNLGGLLVEPVQLVFAAAFLQVLPAQEPPGVGADEEREVSLLADELFVDEAFVDDDLADRQGERGVGAGADWHEQIGVDRGCVVVGRDRDDLRPVIARLRDVVSGRYAGVQRIHVPHEQQVGVVPVVDGGAEVELAERLVEADVVVGRQPV